MYAARHQYESEDGVGFLPVLLTAAPAILQAAGQARQALRRQRQPAPAAPKPVPVAAPQRNLTPWLVGGGALLAVGVLAVVLLRKK